MRTLAFLFLDFIGFSIAVGLALTFRSWLANRDR